MMRSLSHIWFIAAKDLKLFVTDRIAIGMFLLFPFLFVSLFSFVMGDISAEDDRMVLHVVTQEENEGLSHRIARSMETDDVDELDPGELMIVWDEEYDEALRAVDNHSSNGFLSFPEDFTDGISLGYGSHIEVVVDPDATYDRAALNAIGEAIASQIGLQQVVRNAITGYTLEGWLDSSSDSTSIGEELPGLVSIQGGVPMRASLVEYEVETVGHVEAEAPSNFVIPGYLVMFVFMAAAFSAETIVRERQNNTLERLLTSSVRRQAILSGIYTGVALKGLLQIAVFWTVGLLVFQLDLGTSPAAAILLSIVMVLMSSAFAVMLATLVRTQRSASSIALVTSLVLAPLGGCWWPLFVTPRWMQFLAKMTPHGWATTGFNKLLLFGGDFSTVAPEMLAVAAFGVVFAVIAMLRFRTSAV